MDFSINKAIYKLLLFLWLIRGSYGVFVQHNISATAVEGQNVSLQCIVGDDHAINVIQLEWIKQGKGNEKIEQKIVVFHPGMETFYFKSGSLLETVTSSKTGKLQGSILTLYDVTVKDSGNYICEITSFPNGSIKRISKLQVTEPPASVKMLDSFGFIKEGDEVKITCSASPPPLRYKLRRSKDELFWNSLNGEFILSSVSRNNSDLYICIPEWDSVDLNRQGLNATMELAVNYFDGIECNTSSPLNVSVGEDVAVFCMAKASQNLQYKWMKGDTTLSLTDTLSLTSVMPEQSGTYKLTVVFQDNQLQKDKEVYIHVLSKQSKAVEEVTTCLPLKTTKHLSSFTTPRTNSWSSGATETTTAAISDHFLTSTSKPNTTVTNTQPQNTSRHSTLTDSSSAPPAGTASTLHTSTVQTSTHTVNTNTSLDPATIRKTVTSVITQSNSTITLTTTKDSKSKVYVAVPIALILLSLFIALLYRRYLNQKKMDMPPPFKPPPPPVKYTSVRSYDVHVTDILV